MEDFLRRLLNQDRKPVGETPFPQVASYQYFKDERYRHDIYEFSKEFTEYLATSGTKNVVFLDRAARPAFYGVHEYWKEHFPEKEMPSAYFLNPDALGEEVQAVAAFASLIGVNPTGTLIEVTKDKGEEFASIYTRLQEDKDKPLVVFDTCSHTGRHLLPVLSMLVGQGFKDVRTVTANTPDTVSPIRVAKKIDKNTLLRNCYPFGSGRDVMVKKGNSIVSEVDEDADRARGKQMREEIRQAVRDKGK